MKAAALLLLLFSLPAGAAPPPWYAPQRSAPASPEPGLPADTLDACPKLDLKANEGYADAPAVREVAHVDAAALPLPQDDLDRAGLMEILNTNLEYWNARPACAPPPVRCSPFSPRACRRPNSARR
jgi:hypothetical protein